MQNILITGASRGLGRALMEQLAEAGHRVVGVARGGRELDEVVRAIRERGGEAWALPGDVRDAARIVGEASALVGPLDVLVNNASTLGPVPMPRLGDLRPEELAEVLEVNLVASFRLTRAVVGGMGLRGRGTVVFLSSDAAVEAYPTWGAYGLSKAAQDHMMRTWAAELPALRFLSVDPGEMDTAMHAAAMPEADPSTLQRPRDVARRVVELIAHAESGRRYAP